MKTLYDFWNETDGGVYDFIDKNGVPIDDMNYPLVTEVLNERLIEGEHYEITLNVDINDPYSIAVNRYKKEYPDKPMKEEFLAALYFSIKNIKDYEGEPTALEFARTGKIWLSDGTLW